MSDQEEEVRINAPKNPQDSYDPDMDGACGGGEPFRSLSPGSNSVDNLSMEVQFEEESSRHPSEISSLSYQNLLDDGEGSGQILSRHESEDSNDSFPPDYSDNFNSDNVTRGQNLSDLPTEINVKYREKLSMGPTERTGDLKLGNNFKVGERNEIVMNSRPIIDSHDMMEEIDLESKDIVSMHKVEVEEILPRERVKKRNSLEIRNNIPVVGEIKSYDKDLDPQTYSLQGAKPKIRKQSPGLACRVGDGSGGSGSDREGSNSDRELERPVKKVNLQPMGNALHPHSNTCPVHSSDNKIKNTDLMNVVVNPASSIRSTIEDLSNGSTGHSGPDVENEYDYVKYARIQDGDSYVGMRLAYSSTDEVMKRNSLEVNGFSNNSIIDISREGSPEKSIALHKLDFAAPNVPQKVNEDTLTEIPLNTAESVHGEDKQAFSLSPETTECDSVEVESVTSDGDKSNLGMPLVEDGLSSSQASDNEDYIPPSNQVPKSPTAMLRKKQKSDIEQEMLTTPKEDSKHKQLDAEAIMEDLKAKREALDLAIHDIKSAIQNSKGIALKSPYKENAQEEEEPIWVMREGANPEGKSQNQRHEGINVGRSPCTDNYSRKEQDNVYQMDNEKDRLLENQYSRNDGKSYQPPRGYDSDEEEDGDVKYTRRILGKKYASLPKDDSFDQHPKHKLPSQNGANHEHSVTGNGRNSRSSSDSYKKAYRVSTGSLGSDSEDVGSETEAPSKSSYLKTKTAGDFDTDEETDILLQKQYQKDQYVDIPELSQPPVNRSAQAEKRRSRAKEVSLRDPDHPEVLIEGVLFRAKYLGSTQLISEGQPSKALRMMQAQEAVGRIKAPEGENQPSTAVDLFVSTEKIMVLNTDLQEIMMDHSLRTISYIADIGDILVIMARRRLLSSPGEEILHQKKQAKILCHVFESDEAQLIAQSIGQAFQVAYMEFLKANGIEDTGLMKEIDYQDVLNQQEIYGEELNLFSNKEKHKEVIVPKLKSEVLGIVIVESGWGSMVPTVVLANMAPTGPAARCGQLNIGDQIISINGISLVGLPLSACQNYIKSAKNQTVVKLTVVPCPPVVEVLIKRPDVKYQLGFSVQNGVICSLLRGGIAERGGVRVGHRIIEINNQSVVAVPHEKIVSLLANSVGEIHMRTMPTSIFRLLTGQETPHYL